MKKYFDLSRIVIVLVAIISYVSCSKTESSDGYYFRATVDGTPIEATTFAAISGYYQQGLLLTGLWNNNQNEINIHYKEYPKTGEYTITTPDESSYTNNLNKFRNVTGKLVIESTDNNSVKGTFEFIGTDGNSQVTITEGAFLMPINVFVPEKNSPEVAEEVKKIVSDEVIAQFRESGMEIHQGDTPPNIQGIYLSSPHILMLPHVGDSYEKGHRWPDYTLRFYDQKNGRMTLDYKATNDQGIGQGVYVTGSGNKFSIYAQVVGVEKGVSKKVSAVYSGEISSEGIKNFKSAYILTWKDGDTSNNILMPVGAFRISGDQDGMAKRVSSF